MNILVVLAIAVVFGLLRFRRAGLLVWTVAWWAGIYLLFRFGFSAPIPSSVINRMSGRETSSRRSSLDDTYARIPSEMIPM